MGTYSYSGKAQFLTVNAAGTYDITAYGGQGGAYTGGAGPEPAGLGAEIGGNFALTKGEHLEIVVGNAGSASDPSGGGGGGGSFVLGNGTGNGSGNGTYTLLLAAGGGGGGTYRYAGGAGLISAGNGNGGAGPYDGGGGGSGYNSDGGSGGTSRDRSTGGVGGLNRTGGYAGGIYTRRGDTTGVGGFGGGGSGGLRGGGGGGGFSGGNGGYRSTSGGGGSIDRGAALVAVSGANAGAGKVVITPDVTCFATGTAIRVVRDGAASNIAVEHLAIGDLAVTVSGAHRAIAWIGSRELDCAAYGDPRQVRPIRIAKDAFGAGKPARDLRVSPDHAIAVSCLDEVLVPAFAFLNGATVTQDRDDRITYWHVELEGGHDVLLAEGLPCESYLDVGNRGFFAGGAVALDMALDPGLDAAGSCRERTNDPVLLNALRARLRRQALALGWRLDAADLGGMRLIADGDTILPDADGLAARFVLPALAKDVWLVSAASVPWDVSYAADGRRLGLCLANLDLGDGLSVQRSVALDDARLADGFHPHEGGASYRWTDGRARLDPDLWAGCRGHVFFRLALARPCIPAWRAPSQTGTGLRVA